MGGGVWVEGGSAAIFADWQRTMWLFDLESDPTESINLLAHTSAGGAPSADDVPLSVAHRMLDRLAELRRLTVRPPVNAHGTFSHGWAEHVAFFPARHGGHVAPYDEPDVPLHGAWLAFATYGAVAAAAVLLLPLLPLLLAFACARRRWRPANAMSSASGHAHMD